MDEEMEPEVKPFEFTLDEDGTLSLESAVFQALGYASVCWSEPPRGVFESERAKEAGDKLIEVFMSIAHG